MDECRVADYFVVAGLPPNPVPLEEFSNESVLKPNHRQDPIVDLAVINRSLSEVTPPNFCCIEFTPTGHLADLNHGSIRAPEMYLCYRRGRDKPPLVDIGVLYEGNKERVIPGCEVLYLTPHGRSANINNSSSSRIYITFRRADVKAASDTLAVVDIAVILASKGEDPPHAFCRIDKNLNKGMMGSDVYLCYKKSMAKTNFLAYKPAVLNRYPLDNVPGFDLPDRVAMFCLPLGAIIESWPADACHPAPVFSTFVLTAAAADGDPVYGAAVMFYELMDVSQLDETQRQQLLMGPDGTSQQSSRVVAQNKSICLLSRSPFFSAFKQFLVYIYRMSLASSPPHPAPIERYIAHFLTEVPCPSPQRPRILIQLSTTAITLCQPDESPLPKSGASFIEMLKNLGSQYCVSLLLYTLLEQKLLIHSVRPAVLTSVAEAISNMIFPFHWQCPYIPMCPLSLSYVLNSPTPFIVGVDSRYFDLYDPPHDVICVDLDTNTLIVSPEDRKLHLPKKAAKVLKATLDRLCEQLHQDSYTTTDSELWLDTTPVDPDFKVWKKELQIETSIREAFLRFMGVILKGYNNFLLPITKAPTLVTTDISNLFDIQGFLKSRDKAYHKFYSQLMKTQAFSRFIEERSFVSDKDSSLAFFDECLEKIDESRDEPRLIEMDDAMRSERTAFVMPPEPTGLPPGAQYSYNGFPELDVELYPHVETPQLSLMSRSSAILSGVGSQPCPCSPMTCRTKHEVKTAQKLAMKHVNYPSLWAKCLLWHCYSLWFIHLPTYMKTVHSKTKALRTAFDILVRMQSAKLQPPDEVCYRVLMQLCGLYHLPVLAVKVLFEMKRHGIEPNAITYGFYNKAVLESKWPAGTSATGYQLWMKLRNVVQAVAQFRSALLKQRARRPSVYSNSETESYTDDGQSMDSYQDGSALETSSGLTSLAGGTILIDNSLRPKPNTSDGAVITSVTEHKGTEVFSQHEPSEDLTFTGCASDAGYNSLTLEEASHVSVIIGSASSVESLTYNVAVNAASGQSDVILDEEPVTEDAVAGSQREGDACENNVVECDTPDGVSADDVSPATVDVATASDIPCVQDDVTETVAAVDDADAKTLVDEALIDRSEPGPPSAETHLEVRAVASCSDVCSLPSYMTTAVSPVNSPVHVVRTVVTSDDPLGLFSSPSGTTIMSSQDVGDGSQPRRTSDDTIGRSSCFAGATDISLRKSTSLGRLPSSEVVCDGHSDISKEVVEECPEPNLDQQAVHTAAVLKRPSSATASPRTSMFGSTFRTAASRFASKYREIRQSITPLPSVKTASPAASSSGSLTSVGSTGTGEQPAMSPVVASAGIDQVDEPGQVTNEDTPSPATPSHSRLRVPPALYSPLVKNLLGGLKSLQTSETLLSLASGIESVTISVRDTLIESWGAADELDPETLTESCERDDDEDADSYVERSSDCTQPGPDVSSLQSNSDQGISSNTALDQQIPLSAEDSSDRSSVTGDHPAAFRGSVQSIPQSYEANVTAPALCPIEVEMCSLSRCQTCDNLLYDEEIMAGWTADDSNLNTCCQFCGSKLVPFLQIYIKDYRHCVHPTLTNLSQSMDSMLSVQSGLGVPTANRHPTLTSTTILEDRTAPSTDSGVEAGTVELTDTDATISMSVMQETPVRSSDDELTLVNPSVPPEETKSPSVTVNLVNSMNEESDVCTSNNCDKRQNIDLSRRWGSTDLCHRIGLNSDLHETMMNARSTALESRRWTSECSLCVPTTMSNRNSDAKVHMNADSKIDDVSSVASVGSDCRNGPSKQCITLEPITVPYLSPLVLRKEIENVLDQDGDLCLVMPEFIDQHPIIYWNLIWYFRRLNVPSHMPGFILTAKCVNKNSLPSNVWMSNDSRYVGLHTNWDNIHMHTDHGPLMYTIWNKGHQVATSTDGPGINKSVMQNIVKNIKENDVVSPLRLLLNERAKQRDVGRTRFHSIYRDILFLSFVALGRDCIDHDAYDREFRNMYDELPSRDKARMRVADRAPNQLTMSCRRLFGNLEF